MSTYVDVVEVDEMVTLVRQASDDDPWAGLRAAARLRSEADRLEGVQVRRARVRGLSWAEIAGQLGVSRQAVHRKYRDGSRR
ncbi:sigma factor-like helix-turn-helix DNA-binding protein [Angustibacter speluncae]